MHSIVWQKSSDFDEILYTAADLELDERHVIKNRKSCIAQTLSSTERISCCNYFWGRKINLSRISPANRSRSGPNSVYVDMSQATTFREFWARSAHLGQNGDWDESRGARVFLCGNPVNLLATSQLPIFTKFGYET